MPRVADAGQLAEARRLLALHGGDAARTYDVVRQQFMVLQTRSQLLLTLATITLTITGFSGPKMVESGPFTRWAMVAGLALVLVAVLLLLAGLNVRWLSQFDAGSPEATLAEAIAYRDRKTWRFQAEIALLAAGVAAYVAAVIAYLGG
jgi:cytochrome c oxidase assembly factor CtaG